MLHDPTICTALAGTAQYIYKGWKQRFLCPHCGRHADFALNFLGGRDVVCDGVRFIKPLKQEVAR